MYQVVKRDGIDVDFNIKKISDAIKKAFEAQNRQYNDDIIDFLALKVTAEFEPQIDCYKVHARFTKIGETQLIVTGLDGEKKVYDLVIGRNTYNIKEEGTDEWRY